MTSSLPSSFRTQYQQLVSAGDIEPDAAQAQAVEAFAALQARLADYNPARKSGFLSRLFGGKDETKPIRGLYVHGEVGRGKTMLMDLFFNSCDVAHKRRAHFHEFMADVHERIHAFRQKIGNGEIADTDPVKLTAATIFDEAWLLHRQNMAHAAVSYGAAPSDADKPEIVHNSAWRAFQAAVDHDVLAALGMS